MSSIKAFRMTKESIFIASLFMFVFDQTLLESNYINLGSMRLILIIIQYTLLIVFGTIYISEKNTKTKQRIILMVFAFLVLLGGTIAFDGGTALLTLIIIILASQRFSLERIFKITLNSLLISHAFVILSSIAGVISSQIDNRYIGNYMGSFFNRAYVRHSLGFLVHNQVPLAFMIAYMLYICIRRQKIKLWENLIVIAINLFLFNYCGSRITFILILLIMTFYYFARIYEKVKHKVLSFPRWISLAFIVCAILSLVFCYKYNSASNTFKYLDLWFNNRLSMGNEALRYYRLSLFGSGARAATYEYLIDNTVDNGYVSVLIQRGIIVMPLILAAWTYITYKCAKNNPYITLILIMIALENIINAHLTSGKLIPILCILLNTSDPFLNYKQNGFLNQKRNAITKLEVIRI